MDEKAYCAAMRNQNDALEEELLDMDRHLNETGNCLAGNVLKIGDAIMQEIESFHDPELSNAMRQTLRTLVLG